MFQCLAAELRLDDAKITELANEITEAISKVQNVDEILSDTKADLFTAQNLLGGAQDAETFSQEQLDKAKKVTDDLSKALEAQNTADGSIQTTQMNIDSARKDLAQVKDLCTHICNKVAYNTSTRCYVHS